MKVLDQKHLLKRAAQGLIPESILNRPKQPYRAPEGKSFFSSQETYIQEMLSPEAIQQYRIFNPQAVSSLVAKFKSARASSTKDNMALVSVLSTQILLNQFSSSSAQPTKRQQSATHGREFTESESAVGPSASALTS
jgi:asparagine synthase (glutamine-hydrolysing)